ncbi:MAG: hypothetical protein IPJ30_01065 [Acidobacteria bacterium]|nr:hypothetical protein [Acidobacteriota bacterium]
MDEYRRIGNQYIWIFDMNVARANQPLDAPKQMDVIDSYIERNEISDAVQLIPYLKEVSLDERIPLIARNHATRLIAQIEKTRPKVDASSVSTIGEFSRANAPLLTGASPDRPQETNERGKRAVVDGDNLCPRAHARGQRANR